MATSKFSVSLSSKEAIFLAVASGIKESDVRIPSNLITVDVMWTHNSLVDRGSPIGRTDVVSFEIKNYKADRSINFDVRSFMHSLLRASSIENASFFLGVNGKTLNFKSLSKLFHRI